MIVALDKAIASGKEHRKPYRRSQRFDQSCRPHGSCPYCKNGRLHNTQRRILAAGLRHVADLIDAEQE